MGRDVEARWIGLGPELSVWCLSQWVPDAARTQMLAAGSNMFNTLSGSDASASSSGARDDVSNVGKGFLEGGKVLGKTLFQGVSGEALLHCMIASSERRCGGGRLKAAGWWYEEVGRKMDAWMRLNHGYFCSQAWSPSQCRVCRLVAWWALPKALQRCIPTVLS